MNKYLKALAGSLLLVMVASVVLLVTTGVSQAATCVKEDSEGNLWYKNLPDRKGVLPKTLGYASAAKKCPAAPGLRVEESQDKANCLRSALAVCDASWGGIKLNLNPTVPPSNNQCIFLTAESGKTADDGRIYFRSLKTYGGDRVRPDGTIYCPVEDEKPIQGASPR